MTISVETVAKGLAALLVFVAGLLFCVFGDAPAPTPARAPAASSSREQYANATGTYCPDLLVLEDGKYRLYFSTGDGDGDLGPPAREFASLRAYSEYDAELQARAREETNGSCPPPLFARRETDPQGRSVYRFYPSPFEVLGGLPTLPIETHDNRVPVPYVDAARERAPFNQDLAAGFDPHGLDQGRFDVLDVIHKRSSKTKRSGSGGTT